MKISFSIHGHHYVVHLYEFIVWRTIRLNSTFACFIFRQFLKKHVSIILPVFIFVGWTQTDFILFFLTLWMECLPLTIEFFHTTPVLKYNTKEFQKIKGWEQGNQNILIQLNMISSNNDVVMSNEWLIIFVPVKYILIIYY